MTNTLNPTSTETEHSVGNTPASVNNVLRHVLLVTAVVVTAVGGWGVSAHFLKADPPATGQGPLASLDQSAFAGATGVWIEHVTMIGGGGLLEIRYRILDVDKSEIVHDTVNPPRLVTSDGFEIRFQRHDHSHDDDNRLGATYSEQLVNLGSVVSRGDTVTVIVGTYNLEGVVVQ